MSQNFTKEGIEVKRGQLKERRAYLSSITKQRARDMWNEIESMDFEHPYHIRSNLLAELIGDDWHCALPEKVNPDWAYLLRIVQAVRAAFNETMMEATNG